VNEQNETPTAVEEPKNDVEPIDARVDGNGEKDEDEESDDDGE
jgi:hypothetical protein